MRSIPSPSELILSKQPIDTATLVRWAEESGFQTRRSQGGTSHIVCQHTRYPEIVFKIIAGSDKCGSQSDLGKALKKILKRDSAIAEEFEMQSRKNIETCYQNLPSYFSAEHDFQNGQTVIRDKQLPQLGVTISFNDAHLMENKVRYLESIKRDAFILLNRAKMEYDITIGGARGKFNGILSHVIYDLEPKVIPAYQANDNPTNILKEINEFIWTVAETDDAHDKKLDSLMANDFVGAARIIFHARRGQRSNAVRLERPDGGSFVMIFETASNRRAEIGDIHRGRISEPELARVERTIQTLANAYPKTEPFALRAA